MPYHCEGKMAESKSLLHQSLRQNLIKTQYIEARLEASALTNATTFSLLQLHENV